MKPDKAFILAAGLGQRMRPLTNDMPKPMVKVGGQTLIDRTLDELQKAGVSQTIINTHYKADILQSNLLHRNKPEMIFSYEAALLDTGGGIKKALNHFENKPFYVLSGDGLWQNAAQAPALSALAAKWNPDLMDILILLQPVASMKLTEGVGDYDLDATGRAIRSKDKKGAYMFTSMRINHPKIFDNSPDLPFSYLQLLDHAESQGRLYGLVHQGDWHHISTPQDVAALDQFLLQQKEKG